MSDAIGGAAFAPTCSQCSGGSPCNQSGVPKKKNIWLDFCSSDATCLENTNMINTVRAHVAWAMVRRKTCMVHSKQKHVQACRAGHALFNWTPACIISRSLSLSLSPSLCLHLSKEPPLSIAPVPNISALVKTTLFNQPAHGQKFQSVQPMHKNADSCKCSCAMETSADCHSQAGPSMLCHVLSTFPARARGG